MNTIKQKRAWIVFIAIPLAIATIYGCVLWREVLFARGNGYLFNALKYREPFREIRMILLLLVAISATTYPVIRNKLTPTIRLGFIIVLALALSILIVPEIIKIFGPPPWWRF